MVLGSGFPGAITIFAFCFVATSRFHMEWSADLGEHVYCPIQQMIVVVVSASRVMLH